MAGAQVNVIQNAIDEMDASVFDGWKLDPYTSNHEVMEFLFKLMRSSYNNQTDASRPIYVNGEFASGVTSHKKDPRPFTHVKLDIICNALINVDPSKFTAIQVAALRGFYRLLCSNTNKGVNLGVNLGREYRTDQTEYSANHDTSRLKPEQTTNLPNGWNGKYLPSLIYILLITLPRTITYTQDDTAIKQQLNSAILATILARLFYYDAINRIHIPTHDIFFKLTYELDVSFLRSVIYAYTAINNTLGTDVLNSIVYNMFRWDKEVTYGSTLINTCGFGTTDIDIIIDSVIFSAACLNYGSTPWDSVISVCEQKKTQPSRYFSDASIYLVMVTTTNRYIELINMVKFVLRMKYSKTFTKDFTVSDSIYQNIQSRFVCFEVLDNMKDLLEHCKNIVASSSGGGVSRKNEWLSTKRRVTVKGSRKTVYRSRKTGELRVRSISINSRGTRTVRYVKFKKPSK